MWVHLRILSVVIMDSWSLWDDDDDDKIEHLMNRMISWIF